MPKELEAELKEKARKKFPNDPERQNAYVYGTLDRIEKKRRMKRGRK